MFNSLNSSLLPSSFIIFCLLTPDEDSLSKALVFNCFLCFVVQVSTFLLSCSILSNCFIIMTSKMILPSFHCSSRQFQTISVHFHVFYAVLHEKVKNNLLHKSGHKGQI